MPEKYDVIIIGAGIGGLTAGAILARNGKKVLVLEKNPIVGGYAVNFKRGGFIFDASLHMMQGCNKGGITYNILKKCGLEKRLRFIKPSLLYHSFYQEIDIKIEQSNPDSFIYYLKQCFPKEKKGIDLLLLDVKETLSSYEEFQINGKASPKIISYLKKTCLDIFKEYIQDSKLIALFSQLWAYFGLPPSQLSGYYLPFLIYDYHFNGGYYPDGGSAAISNSLKNVILQNRGMVLLNRSVKKVTVKNNDSVDSVITNDGKEFFGDSIISNIDARHTFLNLIEDRYLSENFIKNLNSLGPSISAFQVYLGLDVNLYKLGFSDYTIFINPDFELDNHYNMFMNNEIEKAPFVITVYSNINQNMHNNKTSVVLATLSGYDYWSKLPKNNYKSIKNMLANILIKRAENFIPNLKSYIKVIDTATPLTMERYTGNYKGAIYGWANNIFQCGQKRSFLKTPIKNLHLTGAWTYPGGGISGVMYSGEMVARYILKDNL